MGDLQVRPSKVLVTFWSYCLALVILAATTLATPPRGNPHRGGLRDIRASVESNTEAIADLASAGAVDAAAISALEGALAELAD